MSGIKGKYQKTKATQDQEIEVLRRATLNDAVADIAADLGLRTKTVETIIDRGVVSRLRVSASATVRCKGCGARLTAFPCFGCERQAAVDSNKLSKK